MHRYAILFSKDGYIKYISHLDLLRLFKRAFKKAGLRLRHSQGFNPHPKMSFAQPLSLGYLSVGEILEFELLSPCPPAEEIRRSLAAQMPPGVDILDCTSIPEAQKSLAALTEAAQYRILFPGTGSMDCSGLAAQFLSQPQITVKKVQKKTGKETEMDIKGMIRSLELTSIDDKIIMTTCLDSGSSSNLSPELLISAFLAYSGFPCQREDIEVLRTKIIFGKNLKIFN